MANNLSNEELADAHLMYGAAGGNAAEAVRTYRDKFPNRFVPGARMFMAIDRRLREHGGLNVIRRGRPRPVLDAIEEDVLEYFADRNRASTRAAARDLGISNHVAVWRVLNANNLHPYHFQTVQDLLPADYNPRLGLCTLVPVAGRA